MLLKLSISNFAIIKQMVFEPVSGLNIITGETGAGKSIILDAFNLVLGSRADIKTQSEWGEKTVVEAEFALNESPFRQIFSELDIDFDETTIIRREINTQGRSRSFINDTPVSLQQLKSLTDTLVNIHSQHENQQLYEKSFQFDLLDAYAGHGELLKSYKQQYRQYLQNEKLLQSMILQQDQLLKEKDYLVFLLNEFEKAGLEENEEDKLETELNILSHAELLRQTCDELLEGINDSEPSVLATVHVLRGRFKAIENINNEALDIANRLQSVIIELKDMVSETASLKDKAQSDPVRLELLNQRLSLIQGLKRKHGAENFAALQAQHEKIALQLSGIDNIDNQLFEIRKQHVILRSELKQKAVQLHKNRVETGTALKTKLEKLLKSLEMHNACIEFELQEINDLNEYGCSELQIKFTANLGMPMQLLQKVASGGEISRLALGIRNLEAGQKHINTLVFDEIDTGVSGKVADTIGKMFRQISGKHQLICITHLPQVAGYGDAHFTVCKKEENNTTVSYLKKLDQKERVEELAKMLSGNASTEIAKKNAKELLKV